VRSRAAVRARASRVCLGTAEECPPQTQCVATAMSCHAKAGCASRGVRGGPALLKGIWRGRLRHRGGAQGKVRARKVRSATWYDHVAPRCCRCSSSFNNAVFVVLPCARRGSRCGTTHSETFVVHNAVCPAQRAVPLLTDARRIEKESARRC